MKHYGLMARITELCASNYDEETFRHCLRVADYASENVCLKYDESREIAFVIAMCHDLLEDTDVSIQDICEASGYSEVFLKNVLGALTREKGETYMEYIKRLKANENIFPYVVKLADIKDHLSQTETLTDSLKERYWKALVYLL